MEPFLIVLIHFIQTPVIEAIGTAMTDERNFSDPSELVFFIYFVVVHFFCLGFSKIIHNTIQTSQME